MIRRILIALRFGRLLPRCAAAPPWRLSDAGPCIIPRGHEASGRDDADWHADGNGFIWNKATGHWSWMGPTLDLAEMYRDLPDREPNGFEEWIG